MLKISYSESDKKHVVAQPLGSIHSKKAPALRAAKSGIPNMQAQQQAHITQRTLSSLKHTGRSRSENFHGIYTRAAHVVGWHLQGDAMSAAPAIGSTAFICAIVISVSATLSRILHQHEGRTIDPGHQYGSPVPIPIARTRPLLQQSKYTTSGRCRTCKGGAQPIDRRP